MATAREIVPFLKADFRTRTPKHHRQSLPRRAPGFPSYDTGANPHMSYGLTEARRRRTTAQGACNCPAIMRPFIFGATSGQERQTAAQGACNRPRLCAPSSSPKPAVEKANRHTGSIQPPHGCAPPQLRCNRRSNMGPRPTCHATGAPVTGCGKIAPLLAPMPRLLGAVAED
jgi:hypothetical protein